jgi:CubicO group peptidase (beta-lactamase class C family)
VINEYRVHLETVLAERHMPGLAAAVTRGGETLFAAGVGLADVSAGTAATPDTVFGIGSVTKSFTALAIMQLVDAGRLHVEDRVADYLPALGSSATPGLADVTLHHLLTNTSGLPPLPYLDQALAKSVRADPSRELIGLPETKYDRSLDTVDELVEALAASGVSLVRPPGTIFSYSNDGFAMLGRVVELVSGTGYEEYVHANLLAPLGMTRSLFSPTQLAQMTDVTELYSYIGGFERVEHTPGWWEAPAMTSAGFLKSTANDMARYGEVYLGLHPDIVSPGSLALMTTPHARTGPSRYYGYGIMVQPDYRGHKVVEHGGNIKGVGAWLTTVPTAGVVSVVLANITGGPVGNLALAGANAALGAPLDAERVTYPQGVELSPAEVAPLVGTYVSGEGAEVTVFSTDDGGVGVTISRDTPPRPVRPVSADALLVDVNGQDALLEFLEPSPNGYQAATFGYRVLERKA